MHLSLEERAKVHDDRIRMMMGDKFNVSATVVGKLMCKLIESFTTGVFNWYRQKQTESI